MSKSFEDFCNGANAERVRKWEVLVGEARVRAVTDGGRDFVASCQRQLRDKRYLSPAQVTALENFDELDPTENMNEYELRDRALEYFGGPEEFIGDR